MTQVLEAVGSVRQSETDPRVIEGLAIPYGVVSAPTLLSNADPRVIRESWAPGSFRDSVAKWMGRVDGGRMAFRSAHGERAIGTVTSLTETDAGIMFQARIRDTPAGNDYLANVADGLNAVSAEVGIAEGTKRLRDGTLLHRSGTLVGLAGSENPAYDGARISLRDMESAMTDETEPTPAPEPEPTPEPPEPTRAEAERSAVSRIVGTGARITRPELVYGRQAEYSYLQDTWKQQKGDGEAADRVRRHQAHLTEVNQAIERDFVNRGGDAVFGERAGDVLSSEIPGAYPTDFLPGLLTPRIFKKRPMGSAFNRVPISDARPRTFPKVTTSTSVATFAEGVAPTATDLATTAVTVTPSAYGTYTDVSRQALDGGDPSVLTIIFQDLLEAYSQASETAIKVAVEAGATASGITELIATPYAGALANVVNYFGVRFRPCEYVFHTPTNYATLLAQGDTTGRPFMPMIGAMNSDGTVQGGAIAGNILGAEARLSWASTASTAVYAVSNDYVIYESSIAQFTYDQVVGPQSVRVGLWAYLGIGTRLGGLKIVLS